jgi:sugar lactone lactonase YvrE
MHGRFRRFLGAGIAVGVVSTCALIGQQPAWAASGDITTVAGGPGSGAAINVGQDPIAVASSGSRVWLVDGNAGGYFVRMVDVTTGQESEPTISVPPISTFHTTNPVIAADGNGNLFVAMENPDISDGGVVEKLTPSGQTTVVAGGGTLRAAHKDGVRATSEPLGTLGGIAVDAAGDIYLAENTWSDGRFTTTVTDSRIRKVDRSGIITTVAGTGAVGYAGDGGPGTQAQLKAPMGLVTDPGGNLFIADTGNQRIRVVATSGAISTIAGGGVSTADGVPATTAAVASESIAYDSQGLLIEDERACELRRIANGLITTVVGSGTCGWSADGAAATADIAPSGVTAGPGSSIVFIQVVPGFQHPAGYAGNNANVLRRVDASGHIQHLAGNGTSSYGGDGGPALHAQFDIFTRMSMDSAGNLYLTDRVNLRVRKIDPSGTISTVAGSGVFGYPQTTGDGGPATQASFMSVEDVAAGPDGSIYIADNRDYRIRRVDPSGTITTYVGNGANGNSGDGGPATETELVNIEGMTFDTAGRLVVADGCRLRRVDSDGIITTIAGTPTCAESGDGGRAADAQFAAPLDIVADQSGNIYVGDQDWTANPQTFRVRRIDAAGTITTVAGGGPVKTNRAVPATLATLDDIGALGVDTDGDLLIVDRAGGRVRRVGPNAFLTTVAGGGSGGDGGPATLATLRYPSDVVVDHAGNLLIGCVDTRTAFEGGAIRKVLAS